MDYIANYVYAEIIRRALANEPDGQYQVTICDVTYDDDCFIGHVIVRYFGKSRIQRWYRLCTGKVEEWPSEVRVPNLW